LAYSTRRITAGGTVARLRERVLRSLLSRRSSIRTHIVALFSVTTAAIFILSGVVISCLVYEHMRRNMMDKLAASTAAVRDVVENAARLAVRNHLQTIGQEHIDLFTGLEQRVSEGRMTRDEAMDLAADLVRAGQADAHVTVVVVSGTGMVKVHPDHSLEQTDQSGDRLIQQHLALKNGYLEQTGAVPDDAASKVVYLASFPPWDWLVSVTGDRQVGRGLADDLRHGLQSHHLGKTGYAFIVNGQGTIILHPWLLGNVHDPTNAPLLPLFKQMVTMKNGHLAYLWDEKDGAGTKKKLAFFNRIEDLDWIVASTVYEEEIFEPLITLGRIIGLIVLGGLVLMVALSFSLGNLITRPLARLSRQMQRAADEDVEVYAEEDALGEIGLLGYQFNRYLERLHQSQHALRAEINDRVLAEQQLLIYRQAFDHALEGMVITDPQGTILAVNHSFCDITGYSAEEVIDQNTRLLKSDRHDQGFYRQLWTDLLATDRWSGEIWNRRKDGEVYPEILSISAIRDDHGAISRYVAVFHDITEMKRQEEQIVHQVHHDLLTGLPNRILANDRIEVSIAHVKRGGTKLAILCLDLDNFKNINDSLGHESGDKLLLQVANRLVSQVRAEDTVARLGGDEFLVLVAAVTAEEAVIELAGRLLSSFLAPFNVDGNDFFVTASIGIAFYPQDGHDGATLIKHADIALYQAKKRGKNSYCRFTADLSERVTYLHQLEHQLRQAIAQREFTVLYQPKVAPTSGSIMGAEALVRWQKSDGNLVSPVDFIPLAEETGLIVPLGEQVLEQACQTLALLKGQGAGDLSISVNLSPLQFVQVNLVERILAILGHAGVAPAQLELEITETAMMTDLTKTVATLNQLAAAGIAISVDDFGTGYSSLSYLKRFPIQTLKIDRTFIRDLPTDASDAQLVATIILMAHNLGISVVAEGVETEAQREWLTRCGCDQIQGYLFSKPLPRDRFFALCQQRSLPVPGG
jgi:diguanylate cyclase (GGDEF)-like protein/PAS domain S-box-containing protein